MTSIAFMIAAAMATAVVTQFELTPNAAIERYCEPLLSGLSAERIKEDALASGFQEQVVAGQKVLIKTDLIIALSEFPRVCFVQAPASVTLDQGFELAESWAARYPGAVKSPAVRGPDGAPARGWSSPTKKLSLIATQQTAASGQKVMNFILMPMPQ